MVAIYGEATGYVEGEGCEGLCIDTFTRTESGTWGTSEIFPCGEDALDWVTTGTTTFSVDGSQGVMTFGGSSTGQITLPIPSGPNYEYLLKVGWQTTTVSNPILAALSGDTTALFTDLPAPPDPVYAVRVSPFWEHTGGSPGAYTADIKISARPEFFGGYPGSEVTWTVGSITGITPSTTYRNDVWIRVRFDSTGCYVRGWLDGNSEPGWDATFDPPPTGINFRRFERTSGEGSHAYLDNFEIVEGLDCGNGDDPISTLEIDNDNPAGYVA